MVFRLPVFTDKQLEVLIPPVASTGSTIHSEASSSSSYSISSMDDPLLLCDNLSTLALSSNPIPFLDKTYGYRLSLRSRTRAMQGFSDSVHSY